MRPALLYMLFLALPAMAAEEPKEAEKPRSASPEDEQGLMEELSTLDDADYPDLVGVDEKGEIIDEFAFLQDAGMVESAAKHRQKIGMSPSAVTVITREDIEASGATTITDLLRQVPGMDVILASPALTAVTSRLYWSAEGWHHLVLIDGKEANSEILGLVAWGVQPISLDDVERIEILRGPSSSLYGANAMAGVITITTRSVPEQTSGFVRLAGGELGMMEVEARASTRIGDWGFSVSGGAGLGNSFSKPQELDQRLWKVRAVAEYRWSDKSRLRIDAAMAEGSGIIAGSIGRMDITYGLRNIRVAYDSEDLKGQIYWNQLPAHWQLPAPLEFGGLRLATFAPLDLNAHTFDGQMQWTLPDFWDPLLIIVGGGGRASWFGSDQMLDGDTYADIRSPDYHQPGISRWEGRGGAFVHAEYQPFDWVTVTGSLRFDYNTETKPVLSPRLAAVFNPAAGQFLRLGVTRAFRKPTPMEARTHFMVDFPDDSPITGEGQVNFQEFMSRSVGNPDVENEMLLSFEAGYLGQFLDEKLQVSLDLYLNQLTGLIEIVYNTVQGPQGLPDLEKTTLLHMNTGRDLDIIGAELSVRFDLSRSVSFLAAWAHREVFKHETGKCENRSPKNLITLGGRLRLESGLVGSVFIHSRSEFLDGYVDNPDGLLEPVLSMHMDQVFLVLARLGWRWRTRDGFELEAGAKLFLPVSPLSGPLFRYYEGGGGETPNGVFYGSEQLSRMLTAYLQGSF